MTNVSIPIIAGIVIAVIVVIGVLVMTVNTHPSLAKIVENEDCQELGKWDQRMDEKYGYDVKKLKSELNISKELWSDAIDLGMGCAFDAVSEMYGDSSEENESKSDLEIVYEASKIIKARDCKQFVEWYDDNRRYVKQISYTYKLDLESYHKYCENTDTVLDENGIDVEEQWSMYKSGTRYEKWDRNYRYGYLSEIEETLKNSKSDSKVMYEYTEIIKEQNCKQFIEWYEDNIDHVDVLDSVDDMTNIIVYSYDCEIQNLVNWLKESNPSELDHTKAVYELYWILNMPNCKKYDSWIRIYGEDFDYVKDKLVEEYSSEYKNCKFFNS